jgi:hypothetical protein
LGGADHEACAHRAQSTAAICLETAGYFKNYLPMAKSST